MLKDNAMSNHIVGDNNTVAGRDVNITIIFRVAFLQNLHWMPRSSLMADWAVIRAS